MGTANDYVTLNVRPDTWKQINRLKDPGDTVDDVIQNLLSEYDEQDEQDGGVVVEA